MYPDEHSRLISTTKLTQSCLLQGLNFPIFFCRDPIQGPDVIRSQARNPKNFLLDYDATFDLLGCTPEGNHAGLMFFSDHGTPDGWVNEHGYGCHTFKWVNKQGKSF